MPRPPDMKSQKTYCQFLSFGYCLTVLGDTKGGGLLSAYEKAVWLSKFGQSIESCNQVRGQNPTIRGHSRRQVSFDVCLHCKQNSNDTQKYRRYLYASLLFSSDPWDRFYRLHDFQLCYHEHSLCYSVSCPRRCV